MADLKEKLASEFDFLNVHISEEVLNKCINNTHQLWTMQLNNILGIEICNKYVVEVEDFVNEWMAYTASFLRGEPPSIEALETMERKVYMKDKHKPSKKLKTTPKRPTPATVLQYP